MSILLIIALTIFCSCFARFPQEKITATDFVSTLLQMMVIVMPGAWMAKSGIEVLFLAVGILVCSTYLLGGVEDKKKRRIFLAVGVTAAAIYWCVVICVGGKKASVAPASGINEKLAAELISYGNKILDNHKKDSSWQEFLEQNKSILRSDQPTQNKSQAPDKADLANQPDSPVAGKEGASTPGETSASGSKDSIKQMAVYIDKTVKKVDEYLSETPEATQKRAKLQSKLKKVGNFLKKIKKPETDQVDIEK